MLNTMKSLVNCLFYRNGYTVRMNLFLGPDISQAFWRLVYPTERMPGLSSAVPDTSCCASSLEDVASLLPAWVPRCLDIGYGLDVMVFDGGKRRQSGAHRSRVWGGRIPCGSFYEVGIGVYIPSPAFTFLQMASRLQLPELIAYGDELCGLYSFDPASPRGMRQREAPLISASALKGYIESADPGTRGIKLARRAVAKVVDRSASPMETTDEMLFSLPCRLGGYGFLMPDMNEEVQLGERASLIAGKRSCKGDLCWLDSSLIIEHQGLFDHEGAAAFAADRARVNALKTEGYNVIELTTVHISSSKP